MEVISAINELHHLKLIRRVKKPKVLVGLSSRPCKSSCKSPWYNLYHERCWAVLSIAVWSSHKQCTVNVLI